MDRTLFVTQKIAPKFPVQQKALRLVMRNAHAENNKKEAFSNA